MSNILAVAHESALRTARLRQELENSRTEQKDYLRNVELARVLDKRKDRKRKAAEAKGEQVDEDTLLPARPPKRKRDDQDTQPAAQRCEHCTGEK